MSELPHIMSLKKAAYHLGISEVTLKRRIHAKKLKAYKDGGYWKIKREWLMEYQNGLLKEAGYEEEGTLDNPEIEKQENVQKSENMHISQFPQETQDFIHKLCAKAILRAIRNGAYIEEREGREE